MVTTPPQTKLTYEDYANTPEGERWELIDGELFMVPSPNRAHQRSQLRLGARMSFFTDERDLGEVYADFDVVFSATETVRPDLLFVAKGRLDIITADNVQGAPDLVVEIRSPSTARRDWITKRELYARYGVKEYWIADAEASTITVLTLDDGALQVAAVYGLGDTLLSPALPGFTPAIDDIFRFNDN